MNPLIPHFKARTLSLQTVLKLPLRWHRRFITSEMLELLMENTNVYSVQKHGRSVNTTVKELEQLIGLFLRMGICQMSRNRLYWENDTRFPQVADHMSRNRFQTLLTVIHFVDSNGVSDDQKKDKCWKIRPWLDLFRKQCLEITPGEYNMVDDQMVPFKGKCIPIRQYVKNKPHPWGLKIWARSTSSGILCDFDVYQGGTGKQIPLDVEGDVVVKLCETLPSNQNYKVLADSLFALLCRNTP